MIDFGYKGKRYLVPTELDRLVLEMSLEIRNLEKKVKHLEKDIKIKDGPLEVIKISGEYHLVHSDVISLIESLQAKINRL